MVSADDLARMTVQDASGAPIPFGSLWRHEAGDAEDHDRTAVLVFVRHFGCIHCREHVEQLQRRLSELRVTGAEVIIVGNGAPNFIAGFRDQTRWQGPVYTDPSLAVYKAAGMKRSMTSTFNAKSALKSLGAITRGYMPKTMQGDNWQQGGVLVIKNGAVVWSYESKLAGDNVSVDRILEALG